jgi:hypothetical protein
VIGAAERALCAVAIRRNYVQYAQKLPVFRFRLRWRVCCRANQQRSRTNTPPSKRNSRFFRIDAEFLEWPNPDTMAIPDRALIQALDAARVRTCDTGGAHRNRLASFSVV